MALPDLYCFIRLIRSAFHETIELLELKVCVLRFQIAVYPGI